MDKTVKKEYRLKDFSALKNKSQIHFSSKLFFVAFLILIFLQLISISYSLSCRNDLDCQSGQVCDLAQNGGTCRNCLTSAECWSKTLLKSTPLGGVSPWFSISMIVLGIALAGAAIIYMIAYAFNSDYYKKIALAELMQVLASFFLIGFLFGFEFFETNLLDQLEKTSGTITAALVLSTGGSVSAGALSGNIQVNPFEVSYAFLKNMVRCATNQLKTTYENSKTIETIINTNIQVQVIAPGKIQVSVPNPFSLIQSLSQSAAKYEYLANELTWLIIFLYAQIAVLKFFETSLFTVFLPIGLILRSFPPTRGAGAVLVAIAIGFYFVYPLTFTLLYVGSPQVIEGCNIKAALDTTTLQKTCPANLGATTEILSSSSELVSTLDASIPKMQAGTTTLRFAALVYMLISLGVTFIFVRSFSSILGADISEIGRTMLRML